MENDDEEKIPTKAEQEEIVSDDSHNNNFEITLPTNSNQDTWVEFAPEIEENQMQIGDDTVTVWEESYVVEDTMYLIDENLI